MVLKIVSFPYEIIKTNKSGSLIKEVFDILLTCFTVPWNQRVMPDGQGLVISAVVKTQATTLRRPVNKLILILPKEEQEGVQDKK